MSFVGVDPILGMGLNKFRDPRHNDAISIWVATPDARGNRKCSPVCQPPGSPQNFA